MASFAIPAAIGVAGLLTKTGNQSVAAPPPQIPGLASGIEYSQRQTRENVANQNAFAQALQKQMEGGGPNLAGAQLANATGQNVANQASLMASQRGTGSNAGLIARQVAQQGAGIQQQAAGQAAANRAAQQLNAQGQLGNVYGQIGNEVGQNLASNLSAATGQNQQTVATNQINAGIGQQNNQNFMGQLSGLGQAAAGAFGSTKPSSVGQPGQSDIGNKNVFAAEGGLVKYSSDLSDHHKEISQIFHPHMHQNETEDSMINLHNGYAKGGKVDALVSPGEIRLKPDAAKKVAEGKADPEKVGEKIPGKPNVPGAVNSYANDNIKKKLEVGDVIVPRSETQSKNPKKDSAEFVKAVIEKQGKKKKK